MDIQTNLRYPAPETPRRPLMFFILRMLTEAFCFIFNPKVKRMLSRLPLIQFQVTWQDLQIGGIYQETATKKIMTYKGRNRKTYKREFDKSGTTVSMRDSQIPKRVQYPAKTD